MTDLPTDPPNSTDSGFGKYQLIASLGHGGMADVFLAVARGPVGFNKLQVIKRLRPNLAEEPEFLTMFLDEARLAARLNHPNVVQTNEVGEYGGEYFIAMEYLDGQPLNRIIHRAAKAGSAKLPAMLRIAADALAGLHHAHELTDYDGTPLQVVHRDVSPHNIFVTYEGHTKVVDFGIAKAATRSGDTRAGVLKGKVSYMAPEQARCDTVDRRADIFVMGVVVWELVSGQKMWKGKADTTVIASLIGGEIPSLRDVKPDAPDELVRICSRALAPDPADRYSTAAEMRADILAYLESAGHHVGTEDIAKLVEPLFVDKRAELKAVIERQLTGLKSSGAVSVAILDINGMAATSTSLPRLSTSTNTSQSAEFTPSNQPRPSSTSPAVPVATTAVTQPADKPSRRGALLVAVAAGAALVSFLVLRSGKAPSAGTEASVPMVAATPATPTTAAADPPRKAALIEFTLRAAPENAKVFLDDAPLPSNPFTTKFPFDGTAHRIRVEAAGFVTQNRIAVFDKDTSVEVKLEPEPTADKTPRPLQAQPGQPAALDPPPRTGPGKPAKRKLDSGDPWAQ